MKNIVKKNGKILMSGITRLSPTMGAYILYLLRTHKIPNLKNPRDFNEKMTYLKLNDYAHDERIVRCSDKYLVRDYVKSKGYAKILNDLYGVYDTFDEIDFSKLPDKFALKCTHGCAYNVICHDKAKLDLFNARNIISKWLKEKYGFATQELHYTKIKPRIIAEKNLCDNNGLMPIDYKLYCFNGEVKAIMVATDRDTRLKLNYFSKEWVELNYGKNSWRNDDLPKKPMTLNKMISVAEDLSSGFDFVRVDLYEKDDSVLFGELTFTPACGCAPYYSSEGIDTLGNFIILKNGVYNE